MLSYVEFITTPTADTPGTLLLLHFDSRRYLIGNVAEGAQRACIERGIGLRKVAKVLLTGRTEWANLGGLLGLILSLADTKISAASAAIEARPDQPKQKTKDSIKETSQLDVHGSYNLNHMIATSRRFIFRTGMPINAIEPVRDAIFAVEEPTWQDDLIKVWSMAPISSNNARSPLKRTYDEANGHEPSPTSFQDASRDPFLETKKSVVGQMFNSGWKLDNLVPQPLSSVKPPAKVFIKDPDTKSLMPYEGPLPGGPDPLPEITVYVREPWPGALTEDLPPSVPAQEAMSYIIMNHPQRGKFLPAKAQELKVPKGIKWSELTKGIAVQNDDGRTIEPEEVLAPGKAGGGCAIIDLPSIAYVQPMLQRPEWQSEVLMSGIDAIIWILGKDVISDPRLQEFQSRSSHIKHIISSADTCPNNLALDGAARNAMRHNHVDSDIFPTLQHVPGAADLDLTFQARTVAQRGLRFTLEPSFEMQDKYIKPPIDLVTFQKQVTEEFSTLENAALRLETKESTQEMKAWSQKCFHGDVEVLVLGTGSSHPSRARNVSGTLVRVPGNGSFLLDAGEGTLGTLRRMFDDQQLDEILRDLRMIWISHMHADHHLGLASVVKAWSTATAELTPRPQLAVVSDTPMLHWLHEYGSAEDLGMSNVLPLATKASKNDELHAEQGTQLRHVKAAWVTDQDTRTTADFLEHMGLASLNSCFVSHCRGAQAVSFKTKSGLKISYSGDCRPSSNFALIGRDSDLLIHEATFEDEMRGEALAKRHSTSGEAIIVASEMKAKACLLTHFSQRYPEMPKLGIQLRSQKESPVDGTSTVLEQHQDDGEDTPAHMGGPENEPSIVEAGTAASDAKSTATKQSRPQRFDLIDQNTVQKLLDESGMRVIFAFDYMRVKLGDIPLLERKQPLLREMYDKGIGKDVGDEAHAEEDDSEAATPTEQKKVDRPSKKKARAAELAEQQKANKLKGRKSQQSFDTVAKEIVERSA
jgi:ribonuclease Z